MEKSEKKLDHSSLQLSESCVKVEDELIEGIKVGATILPDDVVFLGEDDGAAVIATLFCFTQKHNLCTLKLYEFSLRTCKRSAIQANLFIF